MNIEMRATPGLGLQQEKKKMWPGFRQQKKKRAGTPAREKENVVGIPAREKEKGWDSSKDIWRGFPQLNDDMVGISTRKGLGF